MGARGIGHIATLTRIAPPRIGVVLNVGTAHLGEYGSVEAIAQAKGELVEALPSAEHGGVAVLNADDPRVRAMAARTSARVVLVGVAGAPRCGRRTSVCCRARHAVVHAGHARRGARRSTSAMSVRTRWATRWPPPPWPASSGWP